MIQEAPFEKTEVLRYLIAKIQATGPRVDDINAFAEAALHAACRTLSEKFDGGMLTVYRVITAPADWEPAEDRHPGIYWSWDRDSAHPYWGDTKNGDLEWLITASAAVEHIDWISTIVANATPAYEQEREIKLEYRADITVLRIEPRYGTPAHARYA